MTENDPEGTRWDLSAFFPDFGGADFATFKQALQTDIRRLVGDVHQTAPLGPETAPDWEQLVLRWEQLLARLGHVSAYIDALAAADTAHEAYGREQAEISALSAEFEQFAVGLGHALKQADAEDTQSFFHRDALRDIAYGLRRIRREANHMMPAEQEALASDLNVDGLAAWERLYNTLSGKLTFTLTVPDGRRETRPISQLRGLLADPDRQVGRAAFDGGNRAWSGIEDVCAAALNAISGNRLTLQRHRHINDFLEPALFQAGIEKETLAAMYAAIHEHLDLARNIYRIKTRFLNRKGIYFFEREAPLPLESQDALSWPAAVAMVQDAFDAAYPRLAGYFRYMLENQWVESAPRPGKRPGAFCMNSKLIGQQRVYMSFTGTLGDVSTLAHEVGHAWHAHLLRDHRPLGQRVPMTLAETASMFAEQVLSRGMASHPALDSNQRLSILDADLSGAAVLLLDITTRFEFEKELYRMRQAGEVPVSQLKEMMVATQHRIYGDVLRSDGADPLFWASKLHFYLTGVAFYNFPYTVGYLLARALHRRLSEVGTPFLRRYEDFLRLTGSDTVENVAERTLGVDITRSAFWSEAIGGLSPDLSTYEALLEKVNS